jgi:hypothetical protein
MTPKQQKMLSMTFGENYVIGGYQGNAEWENYLGRKRNDNTSKTPENIAMAFRQSINREPFQEVTTAILQNTEPLQQQQPPFGVMDEKDLISSFSPIIITEPEEPEKEKFELMNIKIVVYGLNGLMCEKDTVKKNRFGKKENITITSGTNSGKGGLSSSTASSITSGGDPFFSSIEAEILNNNSSVPTTAVISCQKNAISSQTPLVTYLPSLPLQRPAATFVNKVRYAASWPSEQSSLQREDNAMELSSFQIIRCMQQALFVPGAGIASNYIHETLQLGINVSRGTELINLGTASLVINGDEEGEILINIPARPIELDAKKRKKKKNKRNKYGYFSDDPYRRYFLDENATLKVGVQVIPEQTVRFAEEKDKAKKVSGLTQLLQKDDVKELLRQMTSDNIEGIPTLKKNFPDIPTKSSETANQESFVQKTAKSLFPSLLCGAMPSFCTANPFANKSHPTVSDVPMVIHANKSLDHLAITSILSSVSESTDGSYDEDCME